MESPERFRVVVVGQGYVGLPLAVAAARAGHDVIGYDTDPVRIEALNGARSPIDDVTDDDLRDVLGHGRFRASTAASDVVGADIVVLCVPTPYHNDSPHLSHIEGAARAIAPHLAPGSLVILESATYPGTTEELLVPPLEHGSSLRAGTSFEVAFSPERIDPGNPSYGLHSTPKIVGA